MAEQQPGLSRRTFMQGVAAAASTFTLLGCHHNHVLDTGRLVPPPGFDPNITPLTIDVHCHIFNGTDLQVAEFLKETHALPGWAAALLQTINWSFAKRGDDELKALRQLVSTLPAAKLSSASPNGELNSDVRKQIEQQVDQGHVAAQYRLREAVDAEPAQSPKLQWLQHKAGLIDLPVASPAPSHGPSAESDQAPSVPQAAATPQAAAAQRALLLFQQQTALAATGRDQLRRELPSATFSETIEVSAGPETSAPPTPPKVNFDKKSGAIRFSLQYFSPRYVSAQDYLDTFCKKAKCNVDLMFASLVDYDWWLAGGMSPLTPMQTQVEIMEQIAILSGGRVHAFAPFCPLREVANRAGKKGFGSAEVTWSPFALLQDAILNRGFVGVKLYPPMGFAPLGNADLEKLPPVGVPNPPCPGEVLAKPGPGFWNSDDLLPDWCTGPIDYNDGKPPATLGERLDKVLGDLYQWCSDNGVPILAHTNTSNGPTDDFKALAEAAYWEKALKAYPSLRVNFGHLGGFDEGNGLATIPCSSNEYLRTC